MGQKVNPISNRLGVIRGWDSNWYGGKKYGETLLEDSKIRKYLHTRLAKASVSRIIIERTLKMVTVTIATSRPGMIIGKGGKDVDALKEELKKLTDKEVQINIYEIKRPELDAEIVAASIARQIENKVAYRRAVKMAVASTMRMGAEGIRFRSAVASTAPRLPASGCSRRAVRRSTLSVPTSTMRWWRLSPRWGIIGIKVWICRGEVYGKKELTPVYVAGQKEPGRPQSGGRKGGFRNKKNNNR